MIEIRIDYDDDLMHVMGAVNACIIAYGLVFVDDGQQHDGYCIYRLEKTLEIVCT